MGQYSESLKKSNGGTEGVGYANGENKFAGQGISFSGTKAE